MLNFKTMKNVIKLTLIITTIFSNYSCTELDLVQQDAASSGDWYSNEDQFRQSVNELYRHYFWVRDDDGRNGWTDDLQRRTAIYAIKAGTLTSEVGQLHEYWTNMYRGITRAHVVAEEIANQNGILSEETARGLMAEINFSLASYWSYLITHFGDVPFYETEISVEESFELPRTDKEEILQKIYEYYDKAAQDLPITYSGTEYATKGAALA